MQLKFLTMSRRFSHLMNERQKRLHSTGYLYIKSDFALGYRHTVLCTYKQTTKWTRYSLLLLLEFLIRIAYTFSFNLIYSVRVCFIHSAYLI